MANEVGPKFSFQSQLCQQRSHDKNSEISEIKIILLLILNPNFKNTNDGKNWIHDT